MGVGRRREQREEALHGRVAQPSPRALAPGSAGAPTSKVSAKSVVYSRATRRAPPRAPSPRAASPWAAAATSSALGRAQSAGPREADGGVGLRRVGHGGFRQHGGKPAREVASPAEPPPAPAAPAAARCRDWCSSGSSARWPRPPRGWWRRGDASPARRAPDRWPRRWRGSPRTACRGSAAPGETLPGFGALTSSRQASWAAAATSSAGSCGRRRASLVHDARPRRRCRWPPAAPATPGCRSPPGRRPCRRAPGSRSTPAYSAPTAAAARTASAAHASGSSTRPGLAAAGDVGAPPVGAPLDGAEHPAAHHERAHVAALVVDGALEVVHAADRLDGAEHPARHLLVAHPDHAQPHRAEQRLHDHVAQLAEGRDRLLGALADRRSRAWEGRTAPAGRRSRTCPPCARWRGASSSPGRRAPPGGAARPPGR